MRHRIVVVNDRMQQGYQYERLAPIGRGFDPEFTPELTPRDMLRLGVFCGRQVKRWKAIRGHVAQIKPNCEPGDLTCHPHQRQALLHCLRQPQNLIRPPSVMLALVASNPHISP
jgi:hypothetical protein